MENELDKRRWQFSLRWLFFVTLAVASGAWSWTFLYRPDSDAPFTLWHLKRPLATEIFNCSLIGASVLGVLLICNRLANRWRPRFSVRTLLIVVTLVCCYFGAWEATKRYGVRRISNPYDLFYRSKAIAPFVVVDHEEATLQYMEENGIGWWSGPPMTRSTYYLWLLGHHICLRRVYHY